MITETERKVKVLKPEEIYSLLPHGIKDNSVQFDRLTGGLSNINYLVRFPYSNNRPVVMTIYPEQNKWHKVKKEYYVRSLTEKAPSVPIQKIIASGVTQTIDGTQLAYIIKEYLEGDMLNSVLSSGLIANFQENDWPALISDLGQKIAILHGYQLPVFGGIKGAKIIGPDNEASNSFLSWKKYYAESLKRRFNVVSHQPSDKQVSKYRAGDIQILLPTLYEMAFQNLKSLEDVSSPQFVHNDINFLNILASSQKGTWHISGILDFEAALSGDPCIDLVAIESQLHLSHYRSQFMENVDYFRKSYQERKNVPQNYRQRRIPYHISRSLSYFEAVFQMDFKLIPISNVNHFFMEKHFEILEGLVRGKALEDMGINSLF